MQNHSSITNSILFIRSYTIVYQREDSERWEETNPTVKWGSARWSLFGGIGRLNQRGIIIVRGWRLKVGRFSWVSRRVGWVGERSRSQIGPTIPPVLDASYNSLTRSFALRVSSRNQRRLSRYASRLAVVYRLGLVCRLWELM
jgi:hypothetical protein